MNKAILSTLVAALVCVASAAKAESGISSKTLSDMGLSISVMSDSDALAIRGKGFDGHRRRNCETCGSRVTKQPWAAVAGSSFATIDGKDGESHTQNLYAAEGPYGASGENYSEAGSVVTNVETIVVDGSVRSITTTCTTKVFAGGFSSAMAF